MAIKVREINYTDGTTTLRGQLAWDTDASGPQPGVLVAHTWAGCGPFEQGRATALAELGYVALAVDMYGDGIIGSGPVENLALMTPLMADRTLIAARMNAALQQIKSLEEVDASRTAAIGYCFGGLCVLDLARSGAALQGVVSFHGLLKPAEGIETQNIQSSVLVLHGWGDPMAKPNEVVDLAAELTSGGADWQILGYGNTVHAFTNPAAANAEAGTVYSPLADERSWRAMRDFLAERLSD